MAQASTTLWRFAEIELDERTRELRVGGLTTDIEPKCFELLLTLLQRSGEVITFAEFMESVWPGRIVAESAVTNVVSRLRKALNDDGQNIIKTITRIGYRLTVPVERINSRHLQPEVPTLVPGDPVPGRPQWRLKQALQAGGHGDVWLAQHASTGEQRVFKFCIDSARLSALKREVTLNRLLQDALERGDDYVRILEWNFETPPYFIESVYAGLNLCQWIEAKGGLPAIPQPHRIGVLAAIAEALAAAHSIGVLHKDLKPENILIEDRDGNPIVRIGDFGAGKLIDADKLHEFGITQLGFTQSTAFSDSNTGTLIYLAPELISGGTPSVQSDIYSLGVMLYQLVADRLGKPMASGWEVDVADELLRQDIADATNGDRERRLPSAQLLAQRLRGLTARRAELTRQQAEQQRAAIAQKALDRSRARRPWVMAATLVLIIGFATSSYFFVREREQTRIAQEQVQITGAFKEFVTKDIMQAANPDNGGNIGETLRDAVIKSIPKIAERFHNQPLIEASIDTTLSETVGEFDENEKGLALAQQATSLYEKILGPDAVETLIAQRDVAYRLLQLDRLTEANALLGRVLNAWQAKGDPTNSDYIRARLVKLTILSFSGSRPDQRAIAYNKALLSDALAAKIDAGEVCQLKIDLVQNLAGSNQVKEAEQRAREYLPDLERQMGHDARRTFDLRSDLAELEEYEGKYTQAEPEMKDLLHTAEKQEGPQSLRALDADNDLRRLYEDQKQWDKALVFARRNYEGKLQSLGPTDGGTIGPTGRYAWVLAHTGNAQMALPLLENAVVLARTALTADESVIRSLLLLRLVYVLVELQRIPDTTAALKEMAEVKDNAATGDLESPAYWWLARGLVAKAQGNDSEARSDAAQAFGILDKIQNPILPLSVKEEREMLNL